MEFLEGRIESVPPEFVPGVAVQSRSDLDALADGTVSVVVSRLIETLVTLHRVDHEAVGLSRFGRPDGYANRQIRPWAGQWDLLAPKRAGGSAKCSRADRASNLGDASPAVGRHRAR